MATSRRTTQDQAARARIVLNCAEMGAAEVARRSGVTVRTVGKWRKRYVEDGIDGLADAPRSGRPSATGDMVHRTLTCVLEPPREGRWTTRSIAEHIGVSQSTVSRIRREHYPASGSAADPDLPPNAVLTFVHLEPGSSVLVFQSGPTKSGRTHRSASTSREISDAVEVLLCGSICAENVPRGMSIGSGERLRRALQHAPRDRAVTVILDFEPDKTTAAWVRRARSIRTVTVDRPRWLELLAPVAAAIDARQLPELIELERAIREWYGGPRGEFQWTRWDRTSDSGSKVGSAAAEARRETDAAIVVTGLCEAIAEGALHAGRVINARTMTSWTGLSAGTLVDALRHLVEDGLVDQDRAGHFYVPTPAERDVLESYTARGLLGTALVRRLAARGGGVPDAVDALYQRIGRSALEDEPLVTGSLDLDLQDELARAADMPRIEAMFTRLTLQIRLFAAALGVTYQHPVEGIITDDGRVLEAIGSSDQDAAIAAWREKIDNCIRYMVPHLGQHRR